MDTFGERASEIRSLLQPIVALIVKELRPRDDEMSMNRAYDTYTRAWVDHHVAAGNIHRVRRGNKWVVSHAELQCLWAAEHEAPRIIVD